MIAPDRPVCIMEYQPPRDIVERYNDVLKKHGEDTLVNTDEEWRDEFPYGHTWEACNACWSKEVEGERFYVKCMEVAMWYVAIPNRAGVDASLTFCDYHRPKVRENS